MYVCVLYAVRVMCTHKSEVRAKLGLPARGSVLRRSGIYFLSPQMSPHLGRVNMLLTSPAPVSP